jgi:hypothetical protein
MFDEHLLRSRLACAIGSASLRNFYQIGGVVSSEDLKQACCGSNCPVEAVSAPPAKQETFGGCFKGMSSNGLQLRSEIRSTKSETNFNDKNPND